MSMKLFMYSTIIISRVQQLFVYILASVSRGLATERKIQ